MSDKLFLMKRRGVRPPHKVYVQTLCGGRIRKLLPHGSSSALFPGTLVSVKEMRKLRRPILASISVPPPAFSWCSVRNSTGCVCFSVERKLSASPNLVFDSGRSSVVERRQHMPKDEGSTPSAHSKKQVFFFECMLNVLSWWFVTVETPLPIPNRVVKHR